MQTERFSTDLSSEDLLKILTQGMPEGITASSLEVHFTVAGTRWVLDFKTDKDLVNRTGLPF